MKSSNKNLRNIAFIVSAVAAVGMILFSIVMISVTRNLMDEDYLRGSDGYYGDISLLFFFLDIIILAVTVLVVILWKRRRVKSPGWKPKWSKRITRNGYLVLTVLFGALMLAYIGSAIRENHIILTRDYSHDEGLWAEGYYFSRGLDDTLALICAEGTAFSAVALKKCTRT